MIVDEGKHVPTTEEILVFLSGFVQEGGENWREENEKYLLDHARRFHETLKFLPPCDKEAKLLELGASPFFMTLLLEHYTEYTVVKANGFRDGDPELMSIRLVKNNSGEEHVFDYQSFNAEIDHFPYPDNSYDIVLCCELLEHLVLDPTHMFLEIHRILKPSGRVLVTTPNVLVLRNFISLLIHRRNIYGPYSGYGVYGRHNREWTLEEVVQLITGCGFSKEYAQVVDTFPHRGYSRLLKNLFPYLRDMLLVIGRADNEVQDCYPSNLYISLPKQYLLENPLPSRLQNPLLIHKES